MDLRAPFSSLLLLLACTPGGLQDSAGSASKVESGAIDSGSATPWAVEIERVPDALGLADFMYELEAVYTVELTLSDEAYSALSSSPYEYVEGTITFDGTHLDKIGIRLMGRYGSFRSLSGKPAFKISFDEVVPGQNLFGLE